MEKQNNTFLEVLERDTKLSPRVATWFSILENVRQRLLEIIDDLSAEELDFTPNERKVESVGTLLLHIAAVEWSWIFEDIDRKEMPFDEWKYAFPLRPEINLPQLKKQNISFYKNRLAKVRQDVYQRLLETEDSDLDILVGNKEGKFSIGVATLGTNESGAPITKKANRYFLNSSIVFGIIISI